MPRRKTSASSVTSLALLFDGIWILLVWIYLSGGLPWGGGKPLLGHATDVWRIGVGLTLLGGLFGWRNSHFLKQSRVLSGIQQISKKLEGSSSLRWKVFAAGAFLGMAVTSLQTLALRYPMYDVGIFHQILWSLSKGFGFHSSVSKAGNFLLDHFSPSLFLFSPLFWISDSALWMGWIHVFCLFAGGAAWIWFAEKISTQQNKVIVVGVLLSFLSFSSLWLNLKWGFHANSIGFAALSWAFVLFAIYPFARKMNAIAWGLAWVAAGAKETFLLGCGFGFLVWVFLVGRSLPKKDRSNLLIVLLLLSSTVAFGLFLYFETLPKPADKNYFERYYSYLGLDLRTFAFRLLTRPWLVIENVGAGELVRYFVNLMLPFVGLPLVFLFQKKKKWDLQEKIALGSGAFVLPSLISSVLSTYPTLRDPAFHYVFEIWPIFFLWSILALRRFQRPKFIVGIWVALSFLLMNEQPLARVREYAQQIPFTQTLREKLKQIPSSDSVSTVEESGAYLTGRLKVTKWPDLTVVQGQCPRWIVIPEQSLNDVKTHRCFKNRKRVWRDQDTGWQAWLQ